MNPTRLHKGQSVLTLLDDYCVIDIETSNNGRQFGEIVEISALKVRSNQIVSTFDYLIKPTCPIDSWAQSIHHISNEMVKDKPSIATVYPLFMDFIQHDLLVGHNIHFDINFIYDYHQELNQKPLSNDFVDTLRLARLTLKGLPSYSLSNLNQYFGFNPTIHRALSDCVATHHLYQILKNRLSDDEKEKLTQRKVSRYKNSTSLDLEALTPENTIFNPETVFNQKTVLFTGKLTKFTRKQAAQEVVNRGGKVLNEFDPRLDILIVGDINLQLQKYGHLSTKHQMALNYEHISILTEQQFLELIEINQD